MDQYDIEDIFLTLAVYASYSGRLEIVLLSRPKFSLGYLMLLIRVNIIVTLTCDPLLFSEKKKKKNKKKKKKKNFL